MGNQGVKREIEGACPPSAATALSSADADQAASRLAPDGLQSAGAVRRITPEMGDAWVSWDPALEPTPPLTPRQIMLVRLAFLDGWDAAMSAAARLCDEVVSAQMQFHNRDRREDAMETARELAEEIRALASVDTRPKDEDPLGASLASGAVASAEPTTDAQPLPEQHS